MPSLLARVSPFLGLIVTAALAVTPASTHASPQISDVDRQITVAGQRLEVLVERYDAIQADLHATQARIAVTSTRLARLAVELAQKQDQIAAMAAWAYKTTPASLVSGVLSADSPAAFLGRLATIECLARVQGRQISGLTELSDQLDLQRQAWQRLAAQRARQATELKALTVTVQRDLHALQQLRAQIAQASRAAARAAAVPSDRPSGPLPTRRYDQDDASRAVDFAYRQIGKPYRFGAAGPSAYDCSGLTVASWLAAGVTLPHNAARQFEAVPHISRSALRPGDLVFYYGDIHHVAIYVGRGQVIHAPTPGEAVKIQDMDLASIHGYGRPAS